MTTRNPKADSADPAPITSPMAKPSRSERVSGRVSGRAAALPAVARVDRPTRRRAGVFRRAIRHEINRIRDPRRLTMMIILGFVAGVVLAGLIARGETAGADARPTGPRDACG